MSVKQNTLKGEFSLKGKGLHTGKEVCATFKPAAENTGYKIVRVDLDEKTEIPALAKYIELVDRASCLQKDGSAPGYHQSKPWIFSGRYRAWGLFPVTDG